MSVKVMKETSTNSEKERNCQKQSHTDICYIAYIYRRVKVSNWLVSCSSWVLQRSEDANSQMDVYIVLAWLCMQTPTRFISADCSIVISRDRALKSHRHRHDFASSLCCWSRSGSSDFPAVGAISCDARWRFWLDSVARFGRQFDRSGPIVEDRLAGNHCSGRSRRHPEGWKEERTNDLLLIPWIVASETGHSTMSYSLNVCCTLYIVDEIVNWLGTVAWGTSIQTINSRNIRSIISTCIQTYINLDYV